MKNKRGFTLIEIIAVIGILVVVGSVFTINMIKTLNKSNEEEKENIVTEITSAALSYATVNKEEISELYGGYAYIDVTVGELKDHGLLSENIKDPETGEEIPNTDIIRLTLVNGELSADYNPEEKDQYVIKVDDLYVDYNANYDGTWCNSTNEFNGLGDTWGIYNNTETNGSYIDNTNDNISIKSCDVNPKVAGTYSIVYDYYFPNEDGSTKRTITRNVYVGTSSEDVKSFTVVINSGKKIIINNKETPVTITEVKRNGSNNIIEGKIKYENDKYTMVNNENETLDYEIKDFNVTTASSTSTASINKKTKNSDGFYPAKASAKYSVTNVLAELVNAKGNSCNESTYYCDGSVYVNYYGKIFQIYYLNGKTVKIIYEGKKNILKSVAYAQLGTCYNNRCCNGGRYYYKSLGDYNGSYNQNLESYTITSLKYGEFVQGLRYPLMESNLDGFMSEMILESAKNGGSRVLKYITTQKYNRTTFKALLLSEDDWNKIKYYYNKNEILGLGNFWLVEFSKSDIETISYNKGTPSGYVYAKAVDTFGDIVEKGASKRYGNSAGVNAHGVGDVKTDKLYLRPTIQLYNPLVTDGTGTYEEPYIIDVDRRV